VPLNLAVRRPVVLNALVIAFYLLMLLIAAIGIYWIRIGKARTSLGRWASRRNEPASFWTNVVVSISVALVGAAMLTYSLIWRR
jgi:hypothetical protein